MATKFSLRRVELNIRHHKCQHIHIGSQIFAQFLRLENLKEYCN